MHTGVQLTGFFSLITEVIFTDKSIKLYETEMRTLFSLPEEQRGHILTAVLAERLGEPMPELDPMEKAVFSLISAQVKRAEELSEKRKKSVSARWNSDKGENTKIIQNDTKGKSNDTSDIQNHTNVIQNDTKEKNGDTKSYTNTITNTNTNTKNTPLSPKGKVDGFSEFWQAYPRKTAKQAALKAWNKLKPDADLQQTILSALEQQKRSVQWQKDGGQFIPYPATWLNGRRWEDMQIQVVQAPPPTYEFDPNDPYKDWR